jgi:hypothetical protein
MIRVRFSTAAPAEAMTQALEHLAVPGGGPADLTVWVLDEAPTGADPDLGLPVPPVASGVESPLVFATDDGLCAAFEQLRGALHLYDARSREGLVWLPGPEALTLRDRASPLRLVFFWWGRTVGLRLVHAAAVGMPAGGLLLTGRNGSGKSTAALSCLGSGLRLAGDDLVFVDPAGPEVLALYGSAGLDPGHMAAHLPDLAARAGATVDGKTLLFFPGSGPAPIARFPLRAIVVPEVAAGGASALAPRPAARALAALAPGTILQFPGAGAGEFAAFSDLVRRVPCFSLRLGAEPDAVPCLLGDLLGSLGP